MKNLLAIVFALAILLPIASAEDLSADEAIRNDGSLTLCDGSSYFVFSRDGSFHSFPTGISGRCLDGVWKCEDSNRDVLSVEARQSWLNGASALNDYRKIVLAIYRGHNRANRYSSFSHYPPPKEVWEGYFLIEELSKIPSPKK